MPTSAEHQQGSGDGRYLASGTGTEALFKWARFTAELSLLKEAAVSLK